MDLPGLHELAEFPKGEARDFGRLPEADLPLLEGPEGLPAAVFVDSHVEQFTQRGRPVDPLLPHEVLDQCLGVAGDPRRDRNLGHVRIVYIAHQ